MPNNQPFECILHAPSSFRLGDPITVGFEIRNTSSEDYCLLTWDTPLYGDALNFLSVSLEGVVLSYDGRMVNRGDPTDDEYITLVPGEANSSTVDISRLYPIQVPGEYTATLAMTLYDAYPGTSPTARSRAAHEPLALEPTSVTFTVRPDDAPRMTLGQTARLAEQLSRPTEEPPGVERELFQPILIGGSETQREETRRAHAQAIYKVGKACDQLHYYNPVTNSTYRKWFGNNVVLIPFPSITCYEWTKSSYAIIRKVLNYPEFPLLQTYDLTGTGCQPSYIAYTHKDAKTIWLCGLFWPRPTYGGPDSKFGTLIHEWSHARCYLTDYEYGQYGCLSLATSEPKKAVMNPDNYQYFAEFV
jgi:hypothetical protein